MPETVTLSRCASRRAATVRGTDLALGTVHLPPFGAVVFTPLALAPLALDEVLVTAFGIVILFAILSLTLRMPSCNGSDAALDRTWRHVVIPLAAAAVLWLEPITATLGYGQINLLIALLVVWDLSRRDRARGKGALIGIAAGLKLTPLIFVPYPLGLLTSPQTDGKASLRAEPRPVRRMDAGRGAVRLDRLLGAGSRGRLRNPKGHRRSAHEKADVPAQLRRNRHLIRRERSPMNRSLRLKGRGPVKRNRASPCGPPPPMAPAAQDCLGYASSSHP